MYQGLRLTENEPEHVSDRVFRVLAAIRQLGPGAHPLNDIVGHVDLSRSSVQRIIRSGMREGVIRQIRHGHYAIAPAAESAGRSRALSHSVPAYAHRELERLQREVHQAVGLHAAVLVGAPFQTCIACLPVHSGMAVPPWRLGIPRPLAEDASGQVILSHLNVPQLIGPADSRLTQGCGVSSDPSGRNLMIAAPILQDGVPIGAISIWGRRQEIRQSIPSLFVTLKASASRINPLACTVRSRADGPS